MIARLDGRFAEGPLLVRPFTGAQRRGVLNATRPAVQRRPVSYTHLTLPTNREV